jgi:hypothetical protein
MVCGFRALAVMPTRSFKMQMPPPIGYLCAGDDLVGSKGHLEQCQAVSSRTVA